MRNLYEIIEDCKLNGRPDYEELERRIEIMKLNSIVRLKDGRKGKVIGQLANGEYLLASGKGGQITYFKAEDILS